MHGKKFRVDSAFSRQLGEGRGRKEEEQGSALSSQAIGLCVSIEAHSVERHNSSPCMQGRLHSILQERGATLKQENWGRSGHGTSLNWKTYKE